MRNLKNVSIEKLDFLPQYEDRRHYFHRTRLYIGYRNGKSYYSYAYTLLNKYINKPYADAYSHFLKNVNCKGKNEYRKRHFKTYFDGRDPDFFIDKNWIIRENKNSFYYRKKTRPKKPIILKSPDYKVVLIHKVYKKPMPEPFYGFIFTKYGRIKVKKEDFIEQVISGRIYVFESSNDPRYIRIMAERNQKSKANHKKLKKELKEKAYSFLTKHELQLRKEKEIDKYKILKHGFDLITSFRNEKQTNPDLIKHSQGF